MRETETFRGLHSKMHSKDKINLLNYVTIGKLINKCFNVRCVSCQR